MPVDKPPPDDRHLDKQTSNEVSSPWDDPAANRRIDLVGAGAVLFEPAGFRILQARGRSRRALIPYESLTHVYEADRMLLIGTNSGLLSIRNSDFRDPERDPKTVRQALLTRLADRPDGAHLIEGMAQVDQLGGRTAMNWVTWLIVALCILGTGFQLKDPMLEQIGSFMPELFARGEYWRGVTAHFIHGLSAAPSTIRFLLGNLPGLPFHLAMNVGGLIVLGHLVERPLGSWRMVLVLAASGVGSMLGIIFSHHLEVIGASGLVSGLAGAILALELKYPSSLPSYWRLPRRIFVGAVIVQFVVIDQLLWRYVAGGAHLGGFLGGFAATWLMSAPSLEGLVPTARVRSAAYLVTAVVIVGFLGALPLTRHDTEALERHATRLLNLPARDGLYQHENAAAWFIATSDTPSPAGLELAVALADRAVTSTQRMHPDFLDTLAEALFQAGDRLGALIAIDEAIRLMPGERYFQEQRRRFTGERPADDRPPPPGTDFEAPAPLEEPFDPHSIDPAAPILTI